MAEHGGSSVSGFIVAGIKLSIYKILRNIDIAGRSSNEWIQLKDVVLRIEPIIEQIEQYRQKLKPLKKNAIYGRDDKASAVMAWLKGLDAFLQQACVTSQRCSTVHVVDIFSRSQTSERLTSLISNINKHLQMVPLIVPKPVHLEAQFGKLKVGQITQFSSSSASTSTAQTLSSYEQSLIVGQENHFVALEKLLIDARAKGIFRVIAVVGKGGSGKTLLLSRIFNSKKVQDLFQDGLLLWLTVGCSPSFDSLKIQLCQQIKKQKKVHPDTNEDIATWLYQILGKNRFALFLDDVWESREVRKKLGFMWDITHGIVIVSSRNYPIGPEMGASDLNTIVMQDLTKECSWKLFSNYAFPYNKGKVPANIDQSLAKMVCQKCDGLPLAIKVIGSAMAGITDAREWELANLRLPINSHNQQYQDFYDRIRLSFDALGDVNLQLCFLYAAVAFSENQVIHTEYDVMPLWLGEGLLISKSGTGQDGRVEYRDPFEVGRNYVRKLAERCLINPNIKDVHGDVVLFRIHHVIREMAIQIAEHEESFHCRVGVGLTSLNESQYAGCNRIMLNNNKLSSLAKGTTDPAICSLLLSGNKELSKISKTVIGSMKTLQVLDLSGTSLSSLPETVGDLKQLVCLRLRGLPIKSLPASLINLVNLEILELNESQIIELPSGIHKLRSLRCLDLHSCKNLEYLSLNITRLEALQHLEMDKCNILWTKRQSYKEVASIKDLKSLNRLKRLSLQNNGEALHDGTLGGMPQMETLHLTLTNMPSLPPDMSSMSKLRRLSLDCSDMVNMNIRFVEFKNLTRLRLQNCLKLEKPPELHKLPLLKQLDILNCPRMRTFPRSFGERGAFPLLELISLAWLPELLELPVLESGAMPSLKIFSIVECEALNSLPDTYLNLGTLEKVRVYGCPQIKKSKPTIMTSQAHSSTASPKKRKETYLPDRKSGGPEKYLHSRRTERPRNDEAWDDEYLIFFQNLVYA